MDNDTLRRGRPTSHVVSRRRHGDPRRRCAADGGVRAARARAGIRRVGAIATLELARRKLRRRFASSPTPPAQRAWSAARPSIFEAAEAGRRATRRDRAARDARPQDRRAASRQRASPARSWPARPRDVARGDRRIRHAHRPGVSDRRRHPRRRRGVGRCSARPPGKDAAAGKPTYPSLYGLEESRRRAADVRRAGARRRCEAAGLGGQLPAIARVGRRAQELKNADRGSTRCSSNAAWSPRANGRGR